ncbi:MAG: hypothetical protein V2I57_12625 [Xanthomonadales bacterium]|nr:hypothetical protein [Xanthomonadales bacterium]
MSNQERQRLTVAVTGHRDLVESETDRLREQVRWFLEHLVAEYPDLQVEVLSGLAEGADQLVAREALELGLPVTAVLPLALDDYRTDFDDGGAALEALLARCEVITLPGLEGDAPAQDPDARAMHYAQLGVFLSNHCQVLLALWDGKPGDALGGTGSVMAYHLTALMPGFDLGEATPNLLANNENDLAYHIVCSRDRAGGAPEPPLAPGERYWVTSYFGRQSGQHMPFEYDLMLDRLGEFSRDLQRRREEVTAEARGLLDEAPDLLTPSGAAFTDRLYAMADWMAVHYQKKFARGLFLGYALAVAMGVVFIIYSEFIEQWPLAVLFMALFVVGFVLHAVGERREWHRKYLDYRALAEGLRVQVYWNLAGVVSRSAEFAYDNFLQKQDVDLAWIRHVMRSASLRRDRNSAPDPRWVPWVIEQWVGDRASGEGQLGYYAAKSKARAAIYRRTELFGQVALWTGIAMAGLLAVFATRLSDTQAVVLLIFMGILPLLAGIRDAYSHKKADKELIKQYRFMADVFGNARRLLDDSDDPELQRRVLKAVGDAALEEHAEWLLMHRERPLEHGGI